MEIERCYNFLTFSKSYMALLTYAINNISYISMFCFAKQVIFSPYLSIETFLHYRLVSFVEHIYL